MKLVLDLEAAVRTLSRWGITLDHRKPFGPPILGRALTTGEKMRDKVVQLLDLLGFDHMLTAEIDSFLVQYAAQLKAHLNGTHGEEREKAVALLRSTIESRKATLKDAVTDVYEATLDEATVEAVRAFFASEACTRHNEISPAVVQTIQMWFNKQLNLIGDDVNAIFKDAIHDAEVGVIPSLVPAQEPDA